MAEHWGPTVKSKDRRPQKVCERGGNKISYPSKISALMGISRLWRKGRPECHAYYCLECEGWHLSKSRGRHKRPYMEGTA
jgi:hypothetical protein